MKIASKIFLFILPLFLITGCGNKKTKEISNTSTEDISVNDTVPVVEDTMSYTLEGIRFDVFASDFDREKTINPSLINKDTDFPYYVLIYDSEPDDENDDRFIEVDYTNPVLNIDKKHFEYTDNKTFYYDVRTDYNFGYSLKYVNSEQEFKNLIENNEVNKRFSNIAYKDGTYSQKNINDNKCVLGLADITFSGEEFTCGFFLMENLSNQGSAYICKKKGDITDEELLNMLYRIDLSTEYVADISCLEGLTHKTYQGVCNSLEIDLPATLTYNELYENYWDDFMNQYCLIGVSPELKVCVYVGNHKMSVDMTEYEHWQYEGIYDYPEQCEDIVSESGLVWKKYHVKKTYDINNDIYVEKYLYGTFWGDTYFFAGIEGNIEDNNYLAMLEEGLKKSYVNSELYFDFPYPTDFMLDDCHFRKYGTHYTEWQQMLDEEAAALASNTDAVEEPAAEGEGTEGVTDTPEDQPLEDSLSGGL